MHENILCNTLIDYDSQTFSLQKCLIAKSHGLQSTLALGSQSMVAPVSSVTAVNEAVEKAVDNDVRTYVCPSEEETACSRFVNQTEASIHQYWLYIHGETGKKAAV